LGSGEKGERANKTICERVFTTKELQHGIAQALPGLPLYIIGQHYTQQQVDAFCKKIVKWIDTPEENGGGGRVRVTETLHTDARSQKNLGYLRRADVSDDQVSWTTIVPDADSYKPVKFDAAEESKDIQRPSWADAMQFTSVTRPEISPQNPIGRTGISGRGLLYKWGPNHAANPIITRFHSGHLQVMLKYQIDTEPNRWELPGGIIRVKKPWEAFGILGEDVSETVREEFEKEAANLHSDTPKAKLFW